ncbi:hypothetical protein H8959_021935 [Pygathrix nigripes]
MWLRYRRPRYDCWVYFGSVPELIIQTVRILPALMKQYEDSEMEMKKELLKHNSSLRNNYLLATLNIL